MEVSESVGVSQGDKGGGATKKSTPAEGGLGGAVIKSLSNQQFPTILVPEMIDHKKKNQR